MLHLPTIVELPMCETFTISILDTCQANCGTSVGVRVVDTAHPRLARGGCLCRRGCPCPVRDQDAERRLEIESPRMILGGSGVRRDVYEKNESQKMIPNP
jgi:hypothetical protein